MFLHATVTLRDSLEQVRQAVKCSQQRHFIIALHASIAPLLHISLLLRFVWRQRFREDDCCQENNRSSGCPLGCSAVHGLLLQGSFLQHLCAFLSFFMYLLMLFTFETLRPASLVHAVGCVFRNVCACLDKKIGTRTVTRARGGTKDKIGREEQEKKLRREKKP